MLDWTTRHVVLNIPLLLSPYAPIECSRLHCMTTQSQCQNRAFGLMGGNISSGHNCRMMCMFGSHKLATSCQVHQPRSNRWNLASVPISMGVNASRISSESHPDIKRNTAINPFEPCALEGLRHSQLQIHVKTTGVASVTMSMTFTLQRKSTSLIWACRCAG